MDQEGIRAEDDKTRPLNHFCNPQDPDNAMTGGVSALKWGAIGNLQNPDNQWDWEDALRYYREGDKEKAYKALGHVLHLLEDLSTPLHTHVIAHHYYFQPEEARFETYFSELAKKNGNSLPPEYNLEAKQPAAVVTLKEQFESVAKLTFREFEQGHRKVDFGSYYSWESKKLGKLVKNPEPAVLELMGKYLFPKAIEQSAGTMQMFYQALHPAQFAQAKKKDGEVTDAGSAAGGAPSGGNGVAESWQPTWKIGDWWVIQAYDEVGSRTGDAEQWSGPARFRGASGFSVGRYAGNKQA